MGFQDSSWNISTSSLVILVASVLRYRAEKQTDTQTNRGCKPYSATAVNVGYKHCTLASVVCVCPKVKISKLKSQYRVILTKRSILGAA